MMGDKEGACPSPKKNKEQVCKSRIHSNGLTFAVHTAFSFPFPVTLFHRYISFPSTFPLRTFRLVSHARVRPVCNGGAAKVG
ncbi:unnamed protein product [Sympodiomycopsis kandeliae]